MQESSPQRPRFYERQWVRSFRELSSCREWRPAGSCLAARPCRGWRCVNGGLVARGIEHSVVRVPKAGELVAAQLRRQVVTGELKAGDPLPSETTLMERFGVSRPTLREAFRILESESIIVVLRGARGGARVLAPNESVAARHLVCCCSTGEFRLPTSTGRGPRSRWRRCALGVAAPMISTCCRGWS
ncbi:FadR/GntR family transcriptional regulator [Gordonia sp. KTR9]|uniref:FadR/GntR family transcriptional regulator n=1 Tax=Gordonia sp. KTR9 TaxID=337191 RepID=UPI003082E383